MPKNRDEEEEDILAEIEADLEGDEAEDELPEEYREAVERRVKAETNKFKAQYGGRLKGAVDTLRKHGFEITQDGVDVRDKDRAARFLGIDAVAPKGKAEPEKPAVDEDLGEIPDPQYEREKFDAYVLKLAERKATEANRDTHAAMLELQQEVATERLDTAVERAREVLPKFGLGDIADHPDFEDAFKAALVELNIPMSKWRDPKMLARVGGVINADLRAQRPAGAYDDLFDEDDPKPRRGPAGGDVRRALNRETLRSGGPSASGTRVQTDDRYSEIDRKAAELLGVSLEEARALKEQSGRAYDKAAGKRKR